MSGTDRINLDFEFKLASGKAGTFSGYGAVFGNVDAHGDLIEHGAFAASLQDWKAKGKLPKMLLQHGGMFGQVDDMLPIGRWTSMSEDAHGLKVECELFALNTDRGALIYEGLKSGELDGLSIGYRARKSRPGNGGSAARRHLVDVDLREVSIVTWGSNELARVGSAKARPGEVMTNPRAFERFLRLAGFPRKFATAVTAAGFKAAAGASNSNSERRAQLARAIQAARRNLK